MHNTFKWIYHQQYPQIRLRRQKRSNKIIITKLRVFCFTRKIELENYAISIFKLIMPEHYNTVLLESIEKKRCIFRWYNWMWKLDKEDETRKYNHQHTRYAPNKINSCNSMDFFFCNTIGLPVWFLWSRAIFFSPLQK